MRQKKHNPEGLWEAGAEAGSGGSTGLGASFFPFLQRRSFGAQQSLAPVLALLFLTVTLSSSVPDCKMKDKWLMLRGEGRCHRRMGSHGAGETGQVQG